MFFRRGLREDATRDYILKDLEIRTKVREDISFFQNVFTLDNLEKELKRCDLNVNITTKPYFEKVNTLISEMHDKKNQNANSIEMVFEACKKLKKIYLNIMIKKQESIYRLEKVFDQFGITIQDLVDFNCNINPVFLDQNLQIFGDYIRTILIKFRFEKYNAESELRQALELISHYKVNVSRTRIISDNEYCKYLPY